MPHKRERWYRVLCKLFRMAGIREIPVPALRALLEVEERALYNFIAYLVEKDLAEVVRTKRGRIIRFKWPPLKHVPPSNSTLEVFTYAQ